jgi:hypothetical protein
MGLPEHEAGALIICPQRSVVCMYNEDIFVTIYTRPALLRTALHRLVKLSGDFLSCLRFGSLLDDYKRMTMRMVGKELEI